MKPDAAPPARDAAAEWRLDGVSRTESLAQAIARLVRPRDVIGLSGALGTGKTTFARAFIRARAAGEPVDEVPSPTYTLVQPYDLETGPVWHFDLYRVNDEAEAYELGIEEAFAEAISLIEWPEKIARLLPRDRLELAFFFADGAERRRVRIAGHGDWRRRLGDLDFDEGPERG